MKLTKKEREKLLQKFGGRCAYCGCQLPARWHADHLEAVKRGIGFKSAERPENHRIENMMPACPPCNINKASMPLEGWRDWLAQHLKSLNAHNSNYRLVKAFGLIRETGVPVTFYFERVWLMPKVTVEYENAEMAPMAPQVRELISKEQDT